MRLSRKPATIQTSESILRNHIVNSAISNIPIAKIKSLDIQKYYNNLIENGTTPATVYNINKLLGTCFTYTISEDYILKNPCGNIKLPRDKKIKDTNTNDIDVFTDEEANKILSTVAGAKVVNICRTALYTGLRIGEMLALNISDIDFEKEELHVSKTLSYVKHLTVRARGSLKPVSIHQKVYLVFILFLFLKY